MEMDDVARALRPRNSVTTAGSDGLTPTRGAPPGVDADSVEPQLKKKKKNKTNSKNKNKTAAAGPGRFEEPVYGQLQTFGARYVCYLSAARSASRVHACMPRKHHVHV